MNVLDRINRQVGVSAAVMDFANQWRDVPVTWGNDDCSMWPASWIYSRGYQLDIPEYSSEGEAKAIIESYGGLASVWSQIAKSANIPATREPREGDVGIMRTRVLGDVGCIFVQYGMTALLRTSPGFRALPVRPQNIIAAWAVE